MRTTSLIESLKLLTLASSRPRARLCLLRLLTGLLMLCVWFSVLSLLTKTTVGVRLWVRLNRLCMCVVFMLMNTLMNLEVETEKNGILVLFVMVPVSRAPFAFGGLISNIFPGTCVLRWLQLRGPPRKLMTLISLGPVLLIFVILVKAMLAPPLTNIPVWSPLTSRKLFTFRPLVKWWNRKN